MPNQPPSRPLLVIGRRRSVSVAVVIVAVPFAHTYAANVESFRLGIIRHVLVYERAGLESS